MIAAALVLSSYLLSFLLACFFFFSEQKKPWFSLSRALFFVGFAGQALYLVRFFQMSQPLYLFPNTLVFLSFLLPLLFILSKKLLHLPALFLIVPPSACFLLIFGLLISSPSQPSILPASIPKPLLLLHIALVILSYALFILAFASSLFYLIKDDRLKRKMLSPSFFELPPLQDMEKLGSHLLLIGFPLLTVGLLLGFLSIDIAGKGFKALDPKILISSLLWLFYGAALWLRVSKKCTGRKGAYLLIVGFFLLLFTYVGLSFFSGGWHRYL